MRQRRPGGAAAGRERGVAVDDRVLDLFDGDRAVLASRSRSGKRSGCGGTRPSYGSGFAAPPAQGPSGEQTLPHGVEKAETGASGTVSCEAASELCCTW